MKVDDMGFSRALLVVLTPVLGILVAGSALTAMAPMSDDETEAAAAEAEAAAAAEAEAAAAQAAATSAGQGGTVTGITDIPADLVDAFNATAALGIDPVFVAAVAWQESGFASDVINCQRVSSAQAKGIMQIIDSTAASLGVDPCEPTEAINGGARYLLAQFNAFGDWELALAAYNAGPGAVEQHGGIPPYEETENYVVRVMERYRLYQEQQAAAAPSSAASAGAGTQLETVEVTAPDGDKIEVNVTIAAQALTLFDLASRDDIPLGGSGYRSYDRQVELRTAHCAGADGEPGASDYDVYEAPSTACTPQTAIPGTSNHELGLALDLTCDNGRIDTQENQCFRWLADHQAEHGLINLPSEPWHWSVDGH